MCGIAGIVRFAEPHPSDSRRLERMADALVHRGPDDFGYLLADSERGLTRAGQDAGAEFLPDVLLASRRLCITDLSSAGRQPIANEADDVFVVFNGAIHNFVELRAELKARGHRFRTQADTEVIVHAYEEWGEECASRFNGMWAYAIWDKRRKRLVCSRDRFGAKPLLIAWRGNSLYFASEAKAIFAGGEVSATPNLAFLRDVPTLETPVYIRQTAFEGIEQLPPGHNLVVTRYSRSESAYWSYIDRSQEYDFDRPEETFHELFADSLRLRLRADVPCSLLLSGGLDSSSIAVHARQAGEEMEAFTYTVPGFSGDERANAELVAARSGLRLHGVEVEPRDFPDILAAVTWHMENPPRHGQVIGRWRLLEAAAQKAPVVFEGQGADELLGGYGERCRASYLQSELEHLSLKNFHRVLPRLCSAYVGLGSPSRRSIRRALGLRTPPQLHPGRNVLSPEIAKYPNGKAGTRETPPHFSDPLTVELWRDHARLVLPYLLHFGDAISMAHSVESRLPFLDHRLVEFVFGLTFESKIRGRETKHILREAFADKLPPAISRSRRKNGFETPMQSWIRANLDGEIRPRLLAGKARERGVFNLNEVNRCIADFEAGRNGAGIVLFRCLAIELWYEQFIDRDWTFR